MRMYLIVLAVALPAFSATVLVPVNAGFDARTTYTDQCCTPVQEWNTNSPPGWTGVQSGDYKPRFGNAMFIDPLSGPNVAYVNPGGYLYQTLNETLTPDEDYEFGYWVGRRAEQGAASFRLVVTAVSTGPFVEGVNMWTLSDNTGGYAGPPNTYAWNRESLAFNPGSESGPSGAYFGRQLTVWLANDGGGQVNFDAAVPEPSTALLFAAGLLLTGVRALRRRNGLKQP